MLRRERKLLLPRIGKFGHEMFHEMSASDSGKRDHDVIEIAAKWLTSEALHLEPQAVYNQLKK